MSLEQKLSELTQTRQDIMDFDLSRCLQVADKLQLREWDIPVVMVGGTNGKGSVLATLDAAYAQAGYKRMLYTSPHLHRLNERIRFDGVEVTDDAFLAAVNHIEQAAAGAQLTFFEWVTLAALQLAKQRQPDVLLLEVGMGGRLDAVNVVEADLAIITSVALDHTEFLGNTREAIATEKAGIFRPNRLAICGDPDVPAPILQHAKELNTHLSLYQKDYWLQITADGWEWHNAHRRIQAQGRLHLKGQNIATAIQAVDLLQDRLPVSDAMLQSALSDLRLAGRMEYRWWADREFIFDVAHNPQSAEELARRLAEGAPVEGRTWCIFSALTSKNWHDTLKPMLSSVEEWLVPQLTGPRAATLAAMEQHMQAMQVDNFRCFPSPRAALDVFLTESQPGDRCVVWGSFVTVGAIQAEMEK